MIISIDYLQFLWKIQCVTHLILINKSNCYRRTYNVANSLFLAISMKNSCN